MASPTFGLMVLSATAGLGFGALNEIVEFVAQIRLKKLTIFSTLRKTRICVNSCNDDYYINMRRDIYFISNY